MLAPQGLLSILAVMVLASTVGAEKFKYFADTKCKSTQVATVMVPEAGACRKFKFAAGSVKVAGGTDLPVSCSAAIYTDKLCSVGGVALNSTAGQCQGGNGTKYQSISFGCG